MAVFVTEKIQFMNSTNRPSRLSIPGPSFVENTYAPQCDPSPY